MAADLKSATGLNGKILASGQVASASTDTTIYTVPASSAAKVATAVLTNVSGGSLIGVTVSVVPSGQSLDGTRKVAVIGTTASPFLAGDSTKLAEIEGALLDAGTVISVNAPAATAVNYLLTGAVQT